MTVRLKIFLRFNCKGLEKKDPSEMILEKHKVCLIVSLAIITWLTFDKKSLSKNKVNNLIKSSIKFYDHDIQTIFTEEACRKTI